MKIIRRFNSVSDMNTAVQTAPHMIVAVAYENGRIYAKIKRSNGPKNLVISCTENIVRISAIHATSILYRTDPNDAWTTYTEPFAISETVTVYAKAVNAYGEITTSKECAYVPLPSNLTISCSANTVSISATDATTIQYRTNPNDSWTTYTEPFAISETVTVYAKASNTYGEITGSQECAYSTYGVPFYIENISNESGTVSIVKPVSSVPTITIQKSTDGTNWSSFGTTSTTAITATVPSSGKLYLRCSTTAWDNNIITCNKTHKVGGNINSLLYGSSFNGQTEFPSGTGTYTFYNLFKGNTYLTNASDLQLPALTLKDYSYYYMFQGCTSLTSAPALPATTLTPYCYEYMFYSCTSLTTAPTLPATTMANYCYDSMFQDCTSLTTAPELPATTLAKGCYSSMFYRCTSLTTAPELPATTLTLSCYSNMFRGCTNLNYIKCLATDISATKCTSNWTVSVAASGTFVKTPNMPDWTTGASGIPSGWTVEDNTN